MVDTLTVTSFIEFQSIIRVESNSIKNLSGMISRDAPREDFNGIPNLLWLRQRFVRLDERILNPLNAILAQSSFK